MRKGIRTSFSTGSSLVVNVGNGGGLLAEHRKNVYEELAAGIEAGDGRFT